MVEKAIITIYNDWPEKVKVRDLQAIFPEVNHLLGTRDIEPGQSYRVEVEGKSAWLSTTWPKAYVAEIGENRLSAEVGHTPNSFKKIMVRGKEDQVDCFWSSSNNGINPEQGPGGEMVFLTGPCQLVPVINSVIDANHDAIVSWIIEQLGFQAHHLSVQCKCSYFGFSQEDKKKEIYNIRAIFRASGDASLAQPLSGINFTLKDVTVLVLAVLDFTGETLQLSVKTVRVGFSPGEAQDGFRQWLSQYFDTSLAQTLDTIANRTLLNLINSFLGSKLKDKKVKPRAQVFQNWENPISMGRTTIKDYSTWMSTPYIQAKRLSELKIPGTHDSDSFLLRYPYELTERLWDDEADLGKLSRDHAPVGQKVFDGKYYLGPYAYKYVMQQVEALAQTHHMRKSIYQQLQDGIRVFDIRIFYSNVHKKVLTDHTLVAGSLAEVIDQVKSFTGRYPDSQELIILSLSHGDLAGDSPELAKIAALIKKELGEHVFMPANATAKVNYDFQSLASFRVGDITQGKTKVLFVNCDDVCYPHSVLNINDWDNFFGWPARTRHENMMKSMHAPLSQFSLSFTPDLEHVLYNVLYNFVWNPSPLRNFLKAASTVKNAEVRGVLRDHPETVAFLFDWYTESTDRDLPVMLVISANFR